MTRPPEVIVIGAGISGLSAALGAERRGASVTVLEAGSDIGGVIRTTRANGFVVEHGPNSFVVSDAMSTLLGELGILDSLLVPFPAMNRRFIVRDGHVHLLPQSPPALLKSSLLSIGGKVRALSEPLRRKRTSDVEESLASLVARRFGREVLDYFVDPFISGVYAGDAAQLSSRHALRMLGELEQAHGSVLVGAIRSARARRRASGDAAGDPRASHIRCFGNGMQQLPHAMMHALGNRVRLNASVTSVALRDGRWHVRVDADHGADTVTGDRLVVSLPAHAMGAIEWPSSMAGDIEVLSAVPYAPVATIAFGFPRAAVSHALDGFGVLVPNCERRAILGALFNSSTFPGRAPDGQVLLTAFLGGARAQALGDNDVLQRAALGELRALLGISGEPTLAMVTRWERGIPQFNLGHDAVLAAAARLERAMPGFVLTGSYLEGVAVGECVVNGLAAGARAVGA